MDNLRNYPIIGDTFLELDMLGTGVDLPRHYRLPNGKTIVYMNRFRESRGTTKRELIIAGYRVRRPGIMNWVNGRLIQLIPDNERAQVESEILKAIDGENSAKIQDVYFWD